MCVCSKVGVGAPLCRPEKELSQPPTGPLLSSARARAHARRQGAVMTYSLVLAGIMRVVMNAVISGGAAASSP